MMLENKSYNELINEVYKNYFKMLYYQHGLKPIKIDCSYITTQLEKTFNNLNHICYNNIYYHENFIHGKDIYIIQTYEREIIILDENYNYVDFYTFNLPYSVILYFTSLNKNDNRYKICETYLVDKDKNCSYAYEIKYHAKNDSRKIIAKNKLVLNNIFLLKYPRTEVSSVPGAYKIRFMNTDECFGPSIINHSMEKYVFINVDKKSITFDFDNNDIKSLLDSSDKFVNDNAYTYFKFKYF